MLPEIFRFIVATWWLRDLLLGLAFSLVALLIWRQFKRLRIQSNYVLDDERGDVAMFEAAIAKGLNDSQSAYLRGSTARELHRLVQTANKSAKWAQTFGLVALVGSPLSSVIVGANVALIGLTSEQLSFWVTSISSVAAAISAFLGFDDKAITALKAARLTRSECFQFISSSTEYAGLPLDEAFLLLANTLEAMQSEMINADAAAAQAKREAAASGGGGGGEKNSESVEK